MNTKTYNKYYGWVSNMLKAQPELVKCPGIEQLLTEMLARVIQNEVCPSYVYVIIEGYAAEVVRNVLWHIGGLEADKSRNPGKEATWSITHS